MAMPQLKIVKEVEQRDEYGLTAAQRRAVNRFGIENGMAEVPVTSRKGGENVWKSEPHSDERTVMVPTVRY